MPKKKTHNEFVNEVYNLVGDEYTILGIYKNTGTKILIRHNCNICNNHEWEVIPSMFLDTKARAGTRCPVCRYKTIIVHNKLTYEQIKEFIEIESKSECKLLTLKQDYIDTQHKIKIRCKCGNVFETTFAEFKSDNKRQCNECGFYIRGKGRRLDFDTVKSRIEEIDGYTLISNEYVNGFQKLRIMCEKGHIFDKNYSDFINCNSHCPICTYETGFRNHAFTYDEVKQVLNKEGYDIISNEYINSKEKIKIKCDRNHIYEARFGEFKSGNRCPICYEEDRFNPYSTLNIYLRSKIKDWKLDSMKKSNYKCAVTGKPFDDIHHLYSFNKIVEETLEILNYPIYDELGKYSADELTNIEWICNELHYKYGLGVCLTRNVHRKFHHMYGTKNNTPEQFNEFLLSIKNKNIIL